MVSGPFSWSISAEYLGFEQLSGHPLFRHLKTSTSAKWRQTGKSKVDRYRGNAFHRKEQCRLGSATIEAA